MKDRVENLSTFHIFGTFERNNIFASFSNSYQNYHMLSLKLMPPPPVSPQTGFRKAWKIVRLYLLR